MDIGKMQMLGRVFAVLDRREVSDDRIGAFREAVALYHEWVRAREEGVEE